MDDENIPHVTVNAKLIGPAVAIISGLFGLASGLSMYGFVKLCTRNSIENVVDLINVQLEAKAIIDNS